MRIKFITGENEFNTKDETSQKLYTELDKEFKSEIDKFDPNNPGASYVPHIWKAYWGGYGACVVLFLILIIYSICQNQIAIILPLFAKGFIGFIIYATLPLVLFSLIGISQKLLLELFAKPAKVTND